jgi:hemoglobin
MNAEPSKSVPTLYEWAGGEVRFEELFVEFYVEVKKDPLLAPIFASMPSHRPQTVSKFVGEVFGGPHLYTGDHIHSHSSMIAKHLGKHLTDEQRKRWVALLLETADRIGFPNDPEFRSALVGYLEWGSRIAVINSETTDNPIDIHTPMPKWGWGEVQGPFHPKK